MAVSRILSVAFCGLDSLPVEVEVDAISAETSSFVVVGLPDTAVRESKDRVLAALRNTGFSEEHWRFTVNLAPGHIRKEGALYDLPMALGMLQATGKLPKEIDLSSYLLVGELGLSGELRPIRGALPAALLARKRECRGMILPKHNALEASLVPGCSVFGISSLQEAIDFLRNPDSLLPTSSQKMPLRDLPIAVDFAEVYGQEMAKRAMEIAAAGGHNIVLVGPPGTGKTLLAKAMPGIMPPLTFEEALEVTKIHSLAGMLREGAYVMHNRPFRSPHHTVSYAGLMGGGSVPRPGEISLAHKGILFLDELPEFSRALLETLRQPLEDRAITIARARGNLTFPADFILVAAMNPCPCGLWGHPEKVCRDSEVQRVRYRNKISDPLWDRIDMHITVSPIRYQDRQTISQAESSEKVRQRVHEARERQYQRFGKVMTNAEMKGKMLQEEGLDTECQRLVQYAMDEMHCTARATDRILRVARTIADLSGEAAIRSDHLLEALQYREISTAEKAHSFNI